MNDKKEQTMTMLRFIVCNVSVLSVCYIYYSAPSRGETDLFVVMGSMYALALCHKMNICCV